jgi:hypothetical protein
METVTRRTQWFMRLMRSRAGGIPLDFGDELWAPLHDHPAYEWVADRYRELDRPVDDSSIGYYLTRNLLRNVIHAAGAIEYTVERIQSQLAEVQALVDTQVPPLQPGETPPESGMERLPDARPFRDLRESSTLSG